METQTFTETLVVVNCGHSDCDQKVGMLRSFYEQRLDDHKTWWCPRGHGRAFTGQSEAKKQTARADEAERQLRWARENAKFYQNEANRQRRSAAAQKGQVTRIRNLIAAGVCPVPGCRRNFENVREHMATQHPDYHQHEEQA